LKILFITPPDSGFSITQHRYAVICTTICQDRKHAAELVVIYPENEYRNIEDIKFLDADVIILNAELVTNHYRMIQKWKANGKLVFVDFCNPVWFEELAQNECLTENKLSYTRELFSPISRQSRFQVFKSGIRLADAIICNSRRMVEDWSDKPSVYYLPDFLPLDEYLIHRFEPHAGITIGLKLLHNGYEKLLETGLYTAIEIIGKERPESKFLFCGDLTKVYRKIDLPPEQKILIPYTDMADWQKVLSTVDLGLIPFAGTIDERIGWFNALEYMAMKIPWVASENIALSELRQFGWLVQNHSKIWERVLLDMISNISSYKEDTAGEPYLFAIGQGIEEYIEKLYKIINFSQAKASTRELVYDGTTKYPERR
jgi:glycosyltransferase involved in cell wall biosynthesis